MSTPSSGRFHVHYVWVGGIRSTVRLLLKIWFPHCRGCLLLTAVSIPVTGLSVLFSGRSQQQEMEPLLGLCRPREAGLAGPGITGGREGRTEKKEQRVMGLKRVYVSAVWPPVSLPPPSSLSCVSSSSSSSSSSVCCSSSSLVIISKSFPLLCCEPSSSRRSLSVSEW